MLQSKPTTWTYSIIVSSRRKSARVEPPSRINRFSSWRRDFCIKSTWAQPTGTRSPLSSVSAMPKWSRGFKTGERSSRGIWRSLRRMCRLWIHFWSPNITRLSWRTCKIWESWKNDHCQTLWTRNRRTLGITSSTIRVQSKLHEKETTDNYLYDDTKSMVSSTE